MPVRTSSRMPKASSSFCMASALVSSPIRARVRDLRDTSMIEARKMLAIWMISLRMSGVSARTLNMTSSRRMDRSGSSSCTE